MNRRRDFFRISSVTNILQYNISAENLERELELLPEIDNVDVKFLTKNISYTGDYGLEVNVEERDAAPSCKNGNVKLLSFPEGTPMMYFDNRWIECCHNNILFRFGSRVRCERF